MNESSPPDRYAVIGDPVHHSRSPLIHGLFARQTDQHLTYGLIEAPAEGFDAAIREFEAAGGRGLNVTVPHKEAAFLLASVLGHEAEEAGAVNTLTFGPDGIRGDNTDGIGFLRDLTGNLGCVVTDARVLVLGAGGAARGILPPLLRQRPHSVVLANRTRQRAEQIGERFREVGAIDVARFDDLAGERAFDIVVNATSAGLRGEQPPFPDNVVGPDTFCYDLAYGRGGTPFIAWAEARGAGRAAQGVGMLVEQAAESFSIWRRVRPDTRPVIAELSKAL